MTRPEHDVKLFTFFCFFICLAWGSLVELAELRQGRVETNTAHPKRTRRRYPREARRRLRMAVCIVLLFVSRLKGCVSCIFVTWKKSLTCPPLMCW